MINEVLQEFLHICIMTKIILNKSTNITLYTDLGQTLKAAGGQRRGKTF